MEHPAEAQREWTLGVVTRIYPETWEVDIRPLYGTSGLVRRCKVIGTHLPEVHTDVRQSKVVFGHLDAYQQSPVAIPVHNTIIPDDQKADYVYWSEHLGFRITVKQPAHPTTARTGELEIRNLKDGRPLQVRILEAAGVVELRTPHTDVVLNDDEKSVTVDAGESVTINCKHATVNADEDVSVQAGGDVDVQAGGDVDVTASGNATVQAGGNAEITASGNVDVTGALINLNG